MPLFDKGGPMTTARRFELAGRGTVILIAYIVGIVMIVKHYRRKERQSREEGPGGGEET